MTRSGSEDEDKRKSEPPRHSASADAAALHWEETHPVDPEEPPAAGDRASTPRRPGERHSASADAAALRWQEQHPDDEEP